MLNAERIDAVVMWVDGSDPDFMRSEAKALEEERARGVKVITGKARHRDNGELRYVLRALLAHAPWLRRIHVVTNGQVPVWLDLGGDRIRHVRHDQIFPEDAMLPCFNTFAIESCLHRIPDLSETFIRLSDDFFIGRPVSPDDLLGRHGAGFYIFHGKVQADPQTRYQKQISKNVEIFERHTGYRPRFNFAHAPQIRSRKIFEDFVSEFGTEIHDTRYSRFRTGKDLISLFLYPYFHLLKLRPDAAEKLAQGKAADDIAIHNRKIGPDYIQVLLGDPEDEWRDRLRAIARIRPVFFNMNDQFGSESYESDLREMIGFLERMFPETLPEEMDRR